MSLKTTLDNALETVKDALAPDPEFKGLQENLRLKYGLAHAPQRPEVLKWQRATGASIGLGHPARVAGEAAAKEAFKDYHAEFHGKDAPAVEDLLATAKAIHPEP